jgi:hypothetical protein
MRAPPSSLMHAVDSEAVWQIGYDAASSVLYIRFSSGDLYGYEEVPAEVFTRFTTAPSQGRFFHAEIDGNYRYEKL